jgi:prepilin-type N-terminal cleavage/methylation domain-containing protein
VKQRPGFTLIELLIVIIIVGLLATIATNRFWAVKARAYKAAMRSDLRNMATQQERYFDRNYTYANTPAQLTEFTGSAGVTVTITWNTNQGWAGTAAHASAPGDLCGYFTGPAPLGIAAPATLAGIVACN